MSELANQIRALSRGALALAVARYVSEHPEARERAHPIWIDTGVEAWSGRDAEAIAREAARRLEELDAWERDAPRQDPELWEEHRLDALHARLNLQSAGSGAFGTAAGPLADFLRAVGAAPDRLDLH